MKRKILFTFTFLIVLSLLTTGFALAKDTLPSWVMALDHDEFAELGFEPFNWFSTFPPHGYAVTAMTPFNGGLYAYAASWDGAKILYSHDGDSWEALTEFGLGHGSAYTGGWDIVPFNDMLYLGVGSLYAPVPYHVLRSADGTTWESVLTFDHDVDFFTVYRPEGGDTMIYVSTINPGQIWRSPTGDPGSWVLVAELGETVSSTSPFAPFKNWLYICVSDGFGDTGNNMRLLRSKDGQVWEEVSVPVADLFDYGLDVEAHQGYLYLSTGNYEIFPDGSWENRGGRIYRTRDAVDWEVVTSGGFGDVENFAVEGLIVYKDDLYATINRDFGGAQVWRSHKGDPETWEQVAVNGWGDPDGNWGSIRTQQTVFKGELFIAGYSFNAPVWKMVP